MVRLLKYLRDHKNNYTAKSILLTTLAGMMIRKSDKGTESVRTVSDTLVTVLYQNGRLPAETSEDAGHQESRSTERDFQPSLGPEEDTRTSGTKFTHRR